MKILSAITVVSAIAVTGCTTTNAMQQSENPMVGGAAMPINSTPCKWEW